MLFLNSSPIGRLLLLWATGILLACYLQPIHSSYWMMAMLCLLVMVIAIERWRPAWYQKTSIVWIILLPLCLSVLNVHLLDERNSPMHYTHIKECSYKALVKIVAPPETKPNTQKLTVELLQYNNKLPINGTMYLYVNKAGLTDSSFAPAQYLLVQLQPKPIPRSNLPGAFDYASYAARKQIYATAYVPAHQWMFVDSQARGIAATQANITRWLKQQLAHGITNPNALGIAEALLFGNRSDIDQSTWQAYARSGIVHVIAISGMHLGLVYTSLVFLFSWLPGKKRSAVVPALLCLWTFAWITGMPASVMRAAWMFSIIGLGQLLHRSTNTLNTLLASAFIMLVADPWQLFDVGFQLSYLAVLSLHFFYTPLRQKIVPLFPKFLMPVAQLIAATLSAQILTTPWMLYLFHQIPLWVLLTNLIAVPLSTLLIYAELIWVFLWPWHSKLQFIGQGITKAILALNNLAQWVSSQANAVWQTPAWTLAEIALLYILLASTYQWFQQKSPKRLLWVLYSLTALCLLATYENIQATNKQGCIVYYQKPEVALHLYAQGKQAFLANNMPASFWQYQWQPLMAALHLDSNKRLPHLSYQGKGCKAIAANGIQLVYLEKPYSLKQSHPIDVLVLGKQCRPGPWLASWQAKVAIVCARPSRKPLLGRFDSVVYLAQTGAWQGFTSP